MVKLLRILTVLVVIAAAGISIYVYSPKRSAMARMKYADLRAQAVMLSKEKASVDNRSDEGVEGAEKQVALKYLMEDLRKTRQEMDLRQATVAAGAAAAFFLFLNIIQIFFRTLKRGRSVSETGERMHSGRVQTESSKNEYIHPDMLGKRMMAGYETQREAEQWIRTDRFLFCRHCNEPLEGDPIGRVQEVVFYDEEDRGRAGERLTTLGSVFLAIPVDRLRCGKCGRDAIRSARSR